MKRIHYILLCSLMMFMAACEKDTMPVQFAPSVTTGNATDIYRKGAVLSGNIQLMGTATAKSYGILFSELESMAEYTEYPVTDGSKSFSISFSDLTPGTKYYYCTYAHSGYSLVKGAIKSFSTNENNAPIFSSINLLSKNEISCTVSASFLDEGGSEILLSGFCWSKASEGEPTADSHGQIVTITNGVMSAEITGLEPETDYLVRAYASNSTGVGYSESVRITTDAARTPVLSTIKQKEASKFSVSIEAEIMDKGTTAVTAVGFCWSTEKQEPTSEDSSIDLTEQLKDGKNIFSHVLSELKPSTTYYIRAYATNDAGTTYSEVFTFTTAEAKAPTLSTITKMEATNFSVTVEAEITDSGTSAITKAGFCWSTDNKEPTTKDTWHELTDQLSDESKKFNLSLLELMPSTTYYIRAFATNEVGTTYSEVFTFTTAEAKAPTLSAITKKDSSDFSVSLEAEITDGGTSAITKAGYCWSTENKEPTISDTTKELTDQLTIDNKTLSTTLADLKPGTTYYIRAYATNEVGTTYSEVFTFKTEYKDTENGNIGIENLPGQVWK